MAQSDSNRREGSIVWGNEVKGLRLGVAADGDSVRLYLWNAGEIALDVWSHVAAVGVHYDWFTCSIEDGAGRVRAIGFIDNRDRSVPMRKHLAPGERLHHTIDLQSWAARRVNGGSPPAPGSYKLTATYKVDDGRDVWQGELAAGPVELVIR